MQTMIIKLIKNCNLTGWKEGKAASIREFNLYYNKNEQITAEKFKIKKEPYKHITWNYRVKYQQKQNDLRMGIHNRYR